MDTNDSLLVGASGRSLKFHTFLPDNAFYCRRSMVENIAIDARLRLDDSRRVRESVLVRNYEGDTLEQWPPGWHPRVIRHDIVPVTHNCLESLVINCNELPCTEAIL